MTHPRGLSVALAAAGAVRPGESRTLARWVSLVRGHLNSEPSSRSCAGRFGSPPLNRAASFHGTVAKLTCSNHGLRDAFNCWLHKRHPEKNIGEGWYQPPSPEAVPQLRRGRRVSPKAKVVHIRCRNGTKTNCGSDATNQKSERTVLVQRTRQRDGQSPR